MVGASPLAATGPRAVFPSPALLHRPAARDPPGAPGPPGPAPTVSGMPTEDPLSNLRRRLGSRPGTIPDDDQGDSELGEDGDGGGPPPWIPEGRPGQGWLAAIRADPGRAGGIALAVIAALAVLVTAFTLARHRPAPVVSANLPPVQMAPMSAAAPPTAEPAPPSTVVSVIGLVAQPGLVTLAPGARVADAVSAAGGPLRGADTVGLNLARHVADGEQIVVGMAAPAGQPPLLGSSVGGSAGGAPAQAGPPRPGAPAAPGAPAKPAGPLDLNTATAEQLDALPGVGPVTAAAIVAWRAANGRFTAVDQLGEVDGIGPARLDKLRPLVRV